jgi:hypothetical protein
MYKNQKLHSSKKGSKLQAPLASEQIGLGQGFGEDIYELIVSVNMNKVNVPFLIVVSQEVKTDLYVLGFRVENRVFGYTNGTGAIIEQSHSPKL